MSASGQQAVYRVDSETTSVVLVVVDGQLGMAYLGPRLASRTDLADVYATSHPPVPHGELDRLPLEPAFPAHDGRPLDMPALSLRREGAALPVELRVTTCNPCDGGLAIVLDDPLTAVKLELSVIARPGGALQLGSTLCNLGEQPLEVDWLASAHVALEPELTRVSHFGGFWANEFQLRSTRLGDAVLAWGSDRGRSSHGSAAALLATGDASCEASGPALLLCLLWPGNHSLFAGPCNGGGYALQAGLRLAPGELRLAPGDHFVTPPALLAWSDHGLNGLRRQTRRFWAAHCRPRSRPVHLNSWEACYFEHDEASTLELIASAADLGAERFVLDDGWMAGRTGPGLGLGDWRPCPVRYPRGLAPIAAAARDLNMEFGLWIEPEMVTPDSDLARDHPNWIVRAAGREPVTGRGQYLLDVGRDEVRTWLSGVLDRLVADCMPDYIKWDMNRDYAHVGPASGSRALAMTRGWMDIVEQFRQRHPQISLELCGAGGGRSDGGSMQLADRLWPSDSIDAVQRFSVLRCASLLLPPSRLGWHIGAGKAHTSGATYPASTRCILALLGHLGLELDPRRMNDRERDEVRRWIAFFKEHRGWLEGADLSYLDTPAGHPECVLLVAQGGDQALLFLVQTTYPVRGVPQRLKLADLPAAMTWRVTLLNPDDAGFIQTPSAWVCNRSVQAADEILRHIGLRAPPLQVGHCALIHLVAE